MTTKHYSTTTPTRAAARDWYAGLTVAEQTEVDRLAAQCLLGVKSNGKVKFSPDDARELLFALAVWYEGDGEIHRKRHIGDMAATGA